MEFSGPGGFKRRVSARKSFVLQSWHEFSRRFPEDRDCLDFLLSGLPKSESEQCPKCGSGMVYRIKNDRVNKCKICNFETWITAGTFFEGIRKPRAWAAAVWFIGHGILISSSEFQLVAEIAQSTARAILMKLAEVVEFSMEGDDPNLVSSFEFSTLICKRSAETPARMHPVAELDVARQEHFDSQAQVDNGVDDWQLYNLSSDEASTMDDCIEIDSSSVSIYSGLNGQSNSRDVESCLSASSRESEFTNSSKIDKLNELSKVVLMNVNEDFIHIDHLCLKTGFKAAQVITALTMLEISGEVESQPGNLYRRFESSQASVLKKTTVQSRSIQERRYLEASIQLSLEYLREVYHGVSRKYLQKYLALFWTFLERSRWQIKHLLEACIGNSSSIDKNCGCETSPFMIMVLPRR